MKCFISSGCPVGIQDLQSKGHAAEVTMKERGNGSLKAEKR